MEAASCEEPTCTTLRSCRSDLSLISSNDRSVFTANVNPEANTIGFANRAFATKSKKSATGAIVGGVIGGIAFIALIVAGVFFFLRRRRHQGTPPSAMFASDGHIVQSGSEDKNHSFFGFGSSKEKNMDHLMPEPFTMGAGANGGAQHGVTVAPWSPNAPSEQAFLSPAGSTFPQQQQQNGQMLNMPPQQQTYGTTPPPHSATSSGGMSQMQSLASPMSQGQQMRGPTPPGTPGFDQYDRPASGNQYSPVPNPTGQAMWVERS